MKKLVLTGIVFVLTCFLMLISPTNEIKQISFESPEESVITVASTITDSHIVIEYVQTTIQKWQNTALFSPTASLHMYTEEPSLRVLTNLPTSFTGVSSFICAAHHQSSYLS